MLIYWVFVLRFNMIQHDGLPENSIQFQLSSRGKEQHGFMDCDNPQYIG